MMELSNCTNVDDRDKVPSNVSRVECGGNASASSLGLPDVAAGCQSQLQQQDAALVLANCSLEAIMALSQDNVTLEDYPDYAQIPAVRLTFVVIYITIIFLTVCGNSLVVYTVAGQKKMHSSVNYLICNLAVSDLLVGAFVAPMKLLELLAPAHLQLLNNALCTALTFATSVAIFSTILTLLVISMERFFAIVYPLESRRFSKRFRTKLYIALTWIVAALLSGPTLIGSTHVAYSLNSSYGHLDVSICVYDEYDAVHPHFRKGYFLFLFFALYCIPMLIIIVTSILIVKTLIKTGGLISREDDLATRRQAENRRKVATMMIIVSFGFAVCWSPYFFVTVVVEYIYNYFPQGQFFFTMLTINMLGFLNSCINPFIYIMSDRFREQYRRVLRTCCCCMCVKAGWMLPTDVDWLRRRSSTFRTALSRMSVDSTIRRIRDATVGSDPRRNGSFMGSEQNGQSLAMSRLLSVTSDQVVYQISYGTQNRRATEPILEKLENC